MPAKGKSRVTIAQRQMIAAGRFAGKTAKVIANETDLSVSTVNKQGIDARTITLTQELKAKHEKRLSRMYEKQLVGIEHNLSIGKAKKEPMVFLRAARETLRIILEGDPPPQRIDPARSREGGSTYAELLESYRQFDEEED